MDLTYMTDLKESLQYASVSMDLEILDQVCIVGKVISKS